MKNLNLYALANELNLGDPRSGAIRIPFGRWNFGEKQLGDGRTVYFEQELSRAGAEQIAAKVNAGVAAGEKGVPVYWGHPDVPELAHKYPDKRAKGWIKSATIGPDFLELRVEWLEDNATDGFGWFSPYWGGPAEHLANGRYLKTVNDLTSVALVNIPNIQEFRLANELQGGLNDNERTFAMPQRLIELARRYDERVRLANEASYDESKHPRAEDGKWTSAGGGSGGSSGGDDGVVVDGDLNDLVGGSLPELTHWQRTRGEAGAALHKSKAYQSASAARRAQMLDTETKRELRKSLYTSLERKVGTGAALELFRATGLSDLEIHGDPAKVERAAHRAAILSGLKYNRSTHQYE